MNAERITLNKAPPFKKGATIDVSQFNLAIGENGVGKSILSRYVLTAFDPDKRHSEALKMQTSINSTLGTKQSFQSIFIPEIRGFTRKQLSVHSSLGDSSLDSQFDENYASAKLAFKDELEDELITYLKKFNSKIIGFKVTDPEGLRAKILKDGKEKLVPIIEADGFGMNSFVSGFIKLFLYKDESKIKGIFIEEPENHLTPKLQIEFIKSIIEFCAKYDKMLYVNSHSPYIFREFIRHYKNPKYAINYIRKIDGYPTILKISKLEQINEIMEKFMFLENGSPNDTRFTGTFEFNFE